MNKESIIIKTPLVISANEITFERFRDLVYNSFETRVSVLYDYIIKNKKEYSNNPLYTLSFFQIFNDEKIKNLKPCMKFKINEDNIVFETTIYPREVFEDKEEIRKKEEGLKTDNSVYPVACDCNDITKIKNWQSLFGCGEFPFIVIRVFRLGNMEYYSYSITR